MEITLVKVIWNDAHSLSHSWIDIDDIEDEPWVVETVGWILPEVKKNHLVVAQSHILHESYDNIIAIPIAMVVSCSTLL
jgi:hypothetical protein